MLGIEKLCDNMPNALNGIKHVLIYPLAGLGVIAIVMCAVNPFMGMINTGLSNFLNSMGSSSKIVLGCILGGMMSIGIMIETSAAAIISGELAADTMLTEAFLRMGIDELSVSPTFVLKVRDAVRNTDLSKN